MERAVVVPRGGGEGGFQPQLRDSGVKEFAVPPSGGQKHPDSFIAFLLEMKVRGYLCWS